MSHNNNTLASLRHPDYLYDNVEWSTWRDTFGGGTAYLDLYLKRWSDRESETDFQVRKAITPIPTFAKAALLDVRNSIYQRLVDVSRNGGSKNYVKAIAGEAGGVDRAGSSMSTFIGEQVLTELLLMGRCGIFVDAPSVLPSTLSEEARSPYMYMYRVEDILSWTLESPENPGQFKAILLRDHEIDYDTDLGIQLPSGRSTRYRLLWRDDATGKVHYKLMDEEKQPIMLPASGPDGTVILDIEIIPFIMPTIGDSLMKDVASYQHALLNLVSSDVMWTTKSNSPFLTIQQELRSTASHLKNAGTNADSGGQTSTDKSENVGSGRYYDLNTDRPDFIAPPTEPLIASMQLQEKLEDDIRKLINLAVANKSGSRTESAESKKLSSQGLEAGLSFIGMVLQQAEQNIALYWSLYENIGSPNTAKVSYPDRYILKSDLERLDEADKTLELMDRIPGTGIKKALAKMVVNNLLSDKESSESIQNMLEEIESAGYTSSDLAFITSAQESGLVSDELASEALGFRKGEVEKAKEDRVDRALAILSAQTSQSNGDNPASRGVPDLDADPDSGKKEQAAGREEAQLKKGL